MLAQVATFAQRNLDCRIEKKEQRARDAGVNQVQA
jgi:hypothetical protein